MNVLDQIFGFLPLWIIGVPFVGGGLVALMLTTKPGSTRTREDAMPLRDSPANAAGHRSTTPVPAYRA